MTGKGEEPLNILFSPCGLENKHLRLLGLDEIDNLQNPGQSLVENLVGVAISAQLQVVVYVILAHGCMRGLEFDDGILILHEVNEAIEIDTETLAGYRIDQR